MFWQCVYSVVLFVSSSLAVITGRLELRTNLVPKFVVCSSDSIMKIISKGLSLFFMISYLL